MKSHLSVVQVKTVWFAFVFLGFVLFAFAVCLVFDDDGLLVLPFHHLSHAVSSDNEHLYAQKFHNENIWFSTNQLCNCLSGVSYSHICYTGPLDPKHQCVHLARLSHAPP